MTDDRSRQAGYRGALPARDDRLARPWVVVVIAAFLLMVVLAFLGLPSGLIAEPTPIPVPTLPPASGSAEPSISASAEPSVSPSESPSE